MKKLITLFAAIAFSLTAVAQDKKMEAKKDCYEMKDGKMMEMKDGKMEMMTMDVTLKNGTVVMKNGTVKMTDGKTKQMKNGDCIYMDGKMEMKKMENKETKMENK